tara:strand:+ start:7263 stop:7538 length:276 start_codon:yes stop_codon:yes gene_type:complete
MKITENIEAFNLNINMFSSKDAKAMDEALNVFPRFEHNSIRVHPLNENAVQIHNECSDTISNTKCYTDMVNAVKETGIEFRYISLEIALTK